jgi:hypothetical protein
MKSFILCCSLLVSIAASASELEVLKVPAREAGKGSLSTRFEVDLSNQTVGVSVKVTHKTGGKTPYTTFRLFEANVPALSLVGQNVEFTQDGKSTVCGTMGVSRILKVPTLKLSGDCDVVASRVNGNVIVKIVTE